MPVDRSLLREVVWHLNKHVRRVAKHDLLVIGPRADERDCTFRACWRPTATEVVADKGILVLKFRCAGAKVKRVRWLRRTLIGMRGGGAWDEIKSSS